VRGEIFLAEPGTRDAVHALPSRGSVPACEGSVNAVLAHLHDLVAVEPDAVAVCAGVAEGEGAACEEGEVDFLGDESHVGSDFAEVFKSGWSGIERLIVEAEDAEPVFVRKIVRNIGRVFLCNIFILKAFDFVEVNDHFGRKSGKDFFVSVCVPFDVDAVDFHGRGKSLV